MRATFRAEGDGQAIASFFAKEVDDFFVGDDAKQYTAVSFVDELTNDELKALVKSSPEGAPALTEALRGFPLHSYQLADFDRARARSQNAVVDTRCKKACASSCAKVPHGTNWPRCRPMTYAPKICFPSGFMPLPHPHHAEGGMLFPKFHVAETRKQENRDLTRFDLDFDLPDAFLPEFPSAIFLTTRPDLADVSQGKLVTIDNYYGLFNGVLNPKPLEGLRLLVTPFPQQQFNQTEDRRSEAVSRGVTCFDCHVNGHTNGATHLAGDARPQAFRHRIETPT